MGFQQAGHQLCTLEFTEQKFQPPKTIAYSHGSMLLECVCVGPVRHAEA